MSTEPRRSEVDAVRPIAAAIYAAAVKAGALGHIITRMNLDAEADRLIAVAREIDKR